MSDTITPAQSAPQTKTYSDASQRTFLYVATLALEVLGAGARYFIVQLLFLPISFIAWLVTAGSILTNQQGALVEGEPSAQATASLILTIQNMFGTLLSWSQPVALFLAFFPIVFSLLTYIGFPGGALVTFYAMGARRPSRREWEEIDPLIKEICETMKRSLRPTVYVIDDMSAKTHSVGSTLYVSHAAIFDGESRSPHLAPLLAHALGHHATTDARLTLALRRLLLPIVFYLQRGVEQVAPAASQLGSAVVRGGGCLVTGLTWILSLLLSLAAGGFGVLVLAPFWQAYWRLRDYEADQFAARAGYSDALIRFLRTRPAYDVAVPYLGPAEPYSELRIDRLLLGGEVVAERERAENAARVRQIMSYVAGAVGVLVVWLFVQSALNTVRYGVVNTSWELIDFCRSGDCELQGEQGSILQSVAQGRTYTLGFSDTSFTLFESFMQNGTPSGDRSEGVFHYIDDNTIYMNVLNARSSFVSLNGNFDIEKRDGHLILRGSFATYDFVEVGQLTQMRSDATTTAESASRTAAVVAEDSTRVSAQETREAPTITLSAELQRVERLIGRWENPQTQIAFVFNRDGTFTVNMSDNSVVSSGTYEGGLSQVAPIIYITVEGNRTQLPYEFMGDDQVRIGSGTGAGIYTREGSTAESQPTTVAEIVGTWLHSESKGVIVLTELGQWHLADEKGVVGQKGTYTIQGNQLMLTNEAGDSSSVQYQINGDELTLSGDGVTIVYRRLASGSVLNPETFEWETVTPGSVQSTDNGEYYFVGTWEESENPANTLQFTSDGQYAVYVGDALFVRGTWRYRDESSVAIWDANFGDQIVGTQLLDDGTMRVVASDGYTTTIYRRVSNP